MLRHKFVFLFTFLQLQDAARRMQDSNIQTLSRQDTGSIVCFYFLDLGYCFRDSTCDQSGDLLQHTFQRPTARQTMQARCATPCLCATKTRGTHEPPSASTLQSLKPEAICSSCENWSCGMDLGKFVLGNLGCLATWECWSKTMLLRISLHVHFAVTDRKIEWLCCGHLF